VRGPNDFEIAFAEMAEERPDTLLVLQEELTYLYRKETADCYTQSPAECGGWEATR